MAEVLGWSTDADADRPSPARMYDYAPGGSHICMADRAAFTAVAKEFPDVALTARSNRLFLRRAVCFHVTELGISEFLDLGSGVPTAGDVHEIAREISPGAPVMYVDLDPVAAAHSQLLLADNPDPAVLRADVRDPAAGLAAVGRR